MVRGALLALALAFCLGANAQPAKPKPAGLAWGELTVEQQEILAPLKPEWQNLDPDSRRRWIGVAKRYPKMTPKGQERVQKRMQKWASLTPEQRKQARENYRKLAKQRAEEREKLREQWKEYLALPPEERSKHAPPPGKAPAPEKSRK